jgi:hypothetical protein
MIDVNDVKDVIENLDDFKVDYFEFDGEAGIAATISRQDATDDSEYFEVNCKVKLEFLHYSIVDFTIHSVDIICCVNDENGNETKTQLIFDSDYAPACLVNEVDERICEIERKYIQNYDAGYTESDLDTRYCYY